MANEPEGHKRILININILIIIRQIREKVKEELSVEEVPCDMIRSNIHYQVVEVFTK